TYSYYASTIGHYSATGLGLDGVDLRKGFDWKGLLASQAADRGQGVDLDSRFGMTSDFNPGFAARFLVKFIF
ncbi:MAG: hypothetical protein ACXVZZ_12115, partial [Terriglobales bacterium]